MTETPEAASVEHPAWIRMAGYAVHTYTALGACVGFMAAVAIGEHQNRAAFLWLTLAVVIDATDGWLARKIRVKTVLPHLDGSRLDDIVDYLTFTFLPLLMIYRSDWLPRPAGLWVAVPLITSLYAFIHSGAKDAGFFRGFPSYWNIVAFYIAIWLHRYDAIVTLAIVLALSVLSVSPVRFVYPSRTQKMAVWFVGGGLAWLALIGLILWRHYPDPPSWLLAASLVYPAFYVVMSIYLDVAARRLESEEPL